MKKFFLFSSLLILAFIGCQKKREVTQPVQEQTQNGVTIIYGIITFDPGQLHNQAMAAAENYTFNFSSDAAAITSINGFMTTFFQQNEPSVVDADLIQLGAQFIDPRILNVRKNQLPTLIADLKNNNIIGTTEQTLLNNLQSLIVQNASGQIANQAFYDGVIALAAQVTGDMVVAPSVLNITLASCEYWVRDNNIELSKEKALAVPAWVAADGAGALWGAAMSALQQYAQTGDVSLKKTATAALIGGASASLGIVSKIGKGISNLFK